MLDRITDGLLDDFRKQFELSSSSEDRDFERFCNHCVAAKESFDSVDIENMTTAGDGDAGLDGVLIVVNGRPVENVEEIDDLKEINSHLEAGFIFVQAKTSASFDGKDISDLVYSVEDFFSPMPKLVRNECVQSKAEIADHLYKTSAAMTRGLPTCQLYFVTLGRWTNDPNLVARLRDGKNRIGSMDLFSSVNYLALGASEVQQLYLASKRKLEVEIEFEKKVLLPEIPGVVESYLGLLPVTEFFHLIIDENNRIRESVFYDNLRAFQGTNPVNTEIAETINTGKIDQFVILNNGITIVADSLTSVRNKLTLRDFQIVNGCQTGHVLYEHRNAPSIERLFLPVKIVVSHDHNVVASITRATNRQTPVKPEELEALSEFQKRLELFYQSSKQEPRLHYERRSKQYATENEIIKSRIITIPIQIKAFASMFLDQPHRVSRYYGSIVEKLGQSIFSIEHELSAYYASGLAYYRLENLFRSGTIESRFKPLRYHFLMGLRHVLIPSMLPNLNSHKMKNLCEILITKLNDPDALATATAIVAKCMDAAAINPTDRDAIKTQEVTNRLITKLAKEAKTA